ncbi:aminomethyl-transferring glycine dehydrogenase subunit GcvPB [Eubacteriales bacterium OttesenSCG-928-A19]|nr:aminomethyl-transferring glycine dehydrogenase subunit GcvPB [Eubacteriales bacterium OttesenSCG-928-A19]
MSRSIFPTVFEASHPGRRGADVPACDVPVRANLLPDELLAEAPPPLPEMSEVEVVRHFTGLSRRNHGVDNGFYPLGSCTMKYNPRMDETAAAWFGDLHPLTHPSNVQGALHLMYDLERALCEITGMDAMSLQPAAGAHGELTGLMLIRAYHQHNGELSRRRKIIVPDSAHGTNPASAVMAGFEVVEVPSAPDGGVDLEALRAACGEDTAGLMLTNPNTLGLFETRICEMAEIVHGVGGLLYYDGANLNAVMGIVRPGDTGFDVVHLNLHKTFATPHGGGGPGSGPVGCKATLARFLPGPVVVEKDGEYVLEDDLPDSIGKVKAFYGNFGVYVKAYAYILSLGAEGLRAASEAAVLNANYIMHRLKGTYRIAVDRPCMHEFVLSTDGIPGVTATDIAKGLIDYGIHPPTMYFPLIVNEAMMIEPTETEPPEVLDAFCDAMIELANTPAETLHTFPLTTPVGRPDQTKAARKPKVIG